MARRSQDVPLWWWEEKERHGAAKMMSVAD